MFERPEPDLPGAPLPPLPPLPPGVPPILDGRYRLEGQLGEGATGIVLRALHLDLRRTFAVKLLKPLGGAPARCLARFRQEAEALGRLRHPHIVEVTDFGIDGATGTAYLVLEYLDGRPLAGLLREEGPLPVERALSFLTPIAAAVDAAHRQGVLHRDLKPANVFLHERPGAPPLPPQVKVLDFGLAELLGGRPETDREAGAADTPRHAALTAPGALPGTPLYAAPEVIRDQRTSPASDVYSLGVLAYELLAGRPPFQGPTSEVLEGHLEQEPPPIPGLAPEIERELRRLLDKDPARRPESAAAAVARLAEAAARVRLAAFRQAELPRRLGWAALLAAALAVGGASLPAPVLPALEGAFADWRAGLARQRPPDPRLLLVVLDEATLDRNGAALADPVWADELGRLMTASFDAGARGVAVDLTLPAAWNASPGLTAAIVRHVDAVTLAVASEGEQVLGMEVLSEPMIEALGPVRARSLFGFINLDEDADGTVRHGRRLFRLESEEGDKGEGEMEEVVHPTLAERAARRLGLSRAADTAARRFWIDSRIRWQDYPVVSWHDLPARLAQHPGELAGRMVLVGGTWTGLQDRHRFAGQGEVPGLVLHALMIDSLVAGAPFELPAVWVALGAALITGLGLAGVLAGRHPGRAALLLAAGFIGYLGFSVWAYSAAGIVAPVALPVLVLAAGLAAAWIVRLRLPPFPEGV